MIKNTIIGLHVCRLVDPAENIKQIKLEKYVALCANCSGVIPLGADYVRDELAKPVCYCSADCLDAALIEDLTPSFSVRVSTARTQSDRPFDVKESGTELDQKAIMISTGEAFPGMSITQNLGIVDSVIVLKQMGFSQQSSSRGDQILVKDSVFAKKLTQAKREAVEGLKHKARLLGANSVCAVRIEVAQLSDNEVSISAYGTAAIIVVKTVIRR